MQKKKPTFRIEPFRHKLEMDPNYADKTWKVLEDAIHEIHNKNASGLSFEELYRSAYNMVLHKFGDRLYSGLVSTITGHLHKIAAEVDASQDEQFLAELNQRWNDHNKSMQMIRDILMYMDRTYVQQQRKVHVHQLGLDLWRDHVVRHASISARLKGILLDFVKRERSGELIDKQLMRATTKMLVDLGHRVYVDDFEVHFLAAASDFYKVEAHEYLSTSDCPEYLRKAEKRLAEESERVSAYLDSSTEAKITAVVETELISNQMKVLVEMENSGLVALLRDDKYEDLARMYTLFKREHVRDGLKSVREMTGNFIKDTGKQLVMEPERQKDPVEFVQHLLELKDKFDKVILNSFCSDKLFHNTLNQAFETFINLNPRSPEFISLFMDDKLRRGLKGMTEDDVEVVLDKVMMLFRYLQEKDIFEKYYKQHLAKRLLSGRTASDDAERLLLVKLKTECGYQFTSKLESMFTDIKTSRDTMLDYKKQAGKSLDANGIDLSVQVLTTGSWPTQLGCKCNLPAELEECCEHFKKFYLSAHSGRKLSWQTNMGTADVKATFGEKKHELSVSTYQMCILVLFNDTDSMSYRDIQQATEIPPADLKRNLQSLALVKGKNVLRKEPMGREIGDGDVFSFNDAFSSKFYKVKVGTVAAQKESEPEKQETRQKVEEDRKPQIEAAIVRIMKARRVLDHNSIISEVTRQLSPRFLPNPALIKKRIESLIEREFLERDQTDRKLYRYLA